MGFEQVFDNLTFKLMDALRKQIQSLVDYSLNHSLDICNVKQILTMVARIKLLWKSYLFCSDVNKKYDIRQASFTSAFEIFCITSDLGVSGFSYRKFFIFESSQLSEY